MTWTELWHWIREDRGRTTRAAVLLAVVLAIISVLALEIAVLA